MRRSSVPVVAVLLFVALLVLAGCSQWLDSPMKPANTAIGAANTHLQKAASLEDEINSKVSSLDTLPATSEGATRGIEITRSLRDTITSEKKELESAKKLIDSITSMDVEDEYKQYARLESKAIDTRITMTDSTLRLFDAMNVLYGSYGGGSSDVELDEIQAVIAQVKKELGFLGKQAETQADSASRFFTEIKVDGA